MMRWLGAARKGGQSLTLNSLMAVPILLCALGSGSIAQEDPETISATIDLPLFNLDVASFASDDSLTNRVDLYLQLRNERLSFTRSDDRFRALCDITVTVSDTVGTVVREQLWTETIETPSYNETISPSAGKTLQRSMYLAPGTYNLVVQVNDSETRKGASVSRRLTVRQLYHCPLALSDLLLVNSMNTVDGKTVIVPNISGNVGELQEGFHVFFEVYKDSTVDSVELISSVRSSDGVVVRTDSMYRSLQRPKNSLFLSIPNAFLTPGEYTLRVDAIAVPEAGPDSTITPRASVGRSFIVRLRGMPASITDIDRAIDQLTYIASREVIDELKSTPSEKKKDLFLEFWKKKDPVTATEHNELMEEYYSRVGYANAHFGHYQEGWKTDRGMVYIIFGPPSNIERHPFDIDAKPYEIWSYYALNRNFIFVDYTGFGDYRLQNPIWDTWIPRNR